MRGRSILSLADYSNEELGHLLELAARFGEEGIPERHPGRIVSALFFNPSMRTRTAVEIASVSLGAHPVIHDVGGGVWKLESRDGAIMDGDKSEHVRDAVGKFLSGVVDCIGVRSFADPENYVAFPDDPVIEAIRRASTVPVFNLESAQYHPMQALADLLVLANHLRGDPDDHTVAITWAYHPKPLPMAVPNSALLAFARAGYRVRLVHPNGFHLDPRLMARARDLAGDRLTVHHEMDEGLSGANVIYAKSWGAIDEQHPYDRNDPPIRDAHRDWIVDARRQALARPGAFMHCLPVRRNVVVTDDVIDGPHSWVAEQARSRVLTQAAVLHEML